MVMLSNSWMMRVAVCKVEIVGLAVFQAPTMSKHGFNLGQGLVQHSGLGAESAASCHRNSGKASALFRRG